MHPHPQRPQPHISPETPGGSTASFDFSKKKHRGSYNCGRCGLPKKGHVCHLPPTPLASDVDASPLTVVTPNGTTSVFVSSSRPALPPASLSSLTRCANRRRALSFDDMDTRCNSPEVEGIGPELDLEGSGSGGLPSGLMWEVLRRLPPTGLMAAAAVCKGWRDTTKGLWRAAEELRLIVPPSSQLGFVGSVLQKCPGLVRLSLTMESNVEATMLACIAFSCPNLESMEICMMNKAVNRITGDELGRFVADKRCLTTLKMEGCSNLGGFVLSSSSLSTLWLSDLHSLSKMVFNCPNMREISLGFSRQENDTTDLVGMVDKLGMFCTRLQNIHIASVRLSNAVVLALTAAKLRSLRMLSLVLGADITDASVAAISSCYSKLELLDLSGSSITDSGIGIICNVFPATLSRLLLALCPNITSSGIQFATAQLPHLELMDCGLTICDPSSDSLTSDGNSDFELHTVSENKPHLIYQKLIVKHARLKKLSLWGCSGLDALFLNCPKLNDLNLNSCRNLHPERLLLECPSLESVHASGCHKLLIASIHKQVGSDDPPSGKANYPIKRTFEGSKRVWVPYELEQLQQQVEDDGKKRRRLGSSSSSRPCTVVL
ncbi:F-box/LRR-repeat protein 17 [Linum grandiflorum]